MRQHKLGQFFLHQKASGRGVLLPQISQAQWSSDLLTYLRQQGFAVASACLGEGACKRCVVKSFLQEDPYEKISLLSCQYTVGEFMAKAHLFSYPFLHPRPSLWVIKIEISYL